MLSLIDSHGCSGGRGFKADGEEDNLFLGIVAGDQSINDAGWYQFRKWLEYFGTKFGKVTIAVNPAYTSQKCSNCGAVVKKSLSTRTHVCQCGFTLDRDIIATAKAVRTLEQQFRS